MEATIANQESRLSIPTWVAAAGVVVGGSALHLGLHYRTHGVINPHHAALSVFLVVNVLVNFWELVLLFKIRQIQHEVESFQEEYKGRALERSSVFFSQRIPIYQLLSPSRWTGVWSTYALLDPGYAKRDSFGFHIDCGNGWSTIVPATLFAFGMTYEIMPARWLGIVGVAMFWQMLYGTIVYFFQFFYLKRHHGHSWQSVLLLVGGSNGLWMVFPTWGIWLSVQMILNDSYALFV